MFLKFLKFTTSLDYKTEIFDGNSYQILIFRIKKFFKSISFLLQFVE